jgi:hypothetical protein
LRTLIPLIAVLIAGTAFGFPAFQEGVYVYCAGDTLVAFYNSSPTVFDWDGDGLKDLLIACCEESGADKIGTLRFYANVGTNEAPVFDGFIHVQADGENIETLGYC